MYLLLVNHLFAFSNNSRILSTSTHASTVYLKNNQTDSSSSLPMHLEPHPQHTTEINTHYIPMHRYLSCYTAYVAFHRVFTHPTSLRSHAHELLNNAPSIHMNHPQTRLHGVHITIVCLQETYILFPFPYQFHIIPFTRFLIVSDFSVLLHYCFI